MPDNFDSIRQELGLLHCRNQLLSRNPTSTVLAIYPLKALTDEQETKWKQAMDQTGTKVVVGRIDGSVTGQDMRKKILRDHP
jgi:ATP-dependent helicase YprA (DUF1998 family)